MAAAAGRGEREGGSVGGDGESEEGGEVAGGGLLVDGEGLLGGGGGGEG